MIAFGIGLTRNVLLVKCRGLKAWTFVLTTQILIEQFDSNLIDAAFMPGQRRRKYLK